LPGEITDSETDLPSAPLKIRPSEERLSNNYEKVMDGTKIIYRMGGFVIEADFAL